MPRKKGHPKTGGREKGTPNKSSLSLENLVEGYSFDPVGEFIDNLQYLSPDVKSASLLKFLEFVLPKRKQMEVQETASTESPQVVLYLPDNKRRY